jgi:hypothetical protein
MPRTILPGSSDHMSAFLSQDAAIARQRDLGFRTSFHSNSFYDIEQDKNKNKNKNTTKRSPRASSTKLLELAMFQVALRPRVQQFISSSQFWTSACRSVGPVQLSYANCGFRTFPSRKSRARFDRLEKLERLTSLGDTKPDDLRI